MLQTPSKDTADVNRMETAGLIGTAGANRAECRVDKLGWQIGLGWSSLRYDQNAANTSPIDQEAVLAG